MPALLQKATVGAGLGANVLVRRLGSHGQLASRFGAGAIRMESRRGCIGFQLRAAR